MLDLGPRSGSSRIVQKLGAGGMALSLSPGSLRRALTTAALLAIAAVATAAPPEAAAPSAASDSRGSARAQRLVQAREREKAVRSAHGIIGEEFTVGRVRRRVLAQSYVGGIYTRRDPHGNVASTRQTAGADFRLATSRFRGNQNLETTGYFLHADNPSGADGNSFGMTAGMPNDLWNIQMAARQVDVGFDPAIGFVTRRGYRRYQPNVEYGPRPRGSRIVRRYVFGTGLDVQTDVHNELLSRSLDVKLLDVQFQSQDSFNIGYSNNRERLDEALAAVAPFVVHALMQR